MRRRRSEKALYDESRRAVAVSKLGRWDLNRGPTDLLFADSARRFNRPSVRASGFTDRSTFCSRQLEVVRQDRRPKPHLRQAAHGLNSLVNTCRRTSFQISMSDRTPGSPGDDRADQSQHTDLPDSQGHTIARRQFQPPRTIPRVTSLTRWQHAK